MKRSQFVSFFGLIIFCACFVFSSVVFFSQENNVVSLWFVAVMCCGKWTFLVERLDLVLKVFGWASPLLCLIYQAYKKAP